MKFHNWMLFSFLVGPRLTYRTMLAFYGGPVLIVIAALTVGLLLAPKALVVELLQGVRTLLDLSR